MTRLLVVGDTLLDRDVEGSVERVCPDAPAPVLDVREVRDRPGGAGLAALLAARPGVEVVLATGLGADAAGRRVRALLDGVVRVHAVLRPCVTPGKTRVRSQGQSLVRLDDAGHLLGGAGHGQDDRDACVEVGAGVGPDVEVDVDQAALESLVRASDAVLVADYGGAVTRSPAVRSVLLRCADEVPVVWDPHPRGQAPVAGARVATPNRAEASGADGQEGPLADVAARLRHRWGVRAVTVTDGPRGAVLVDGRDPAVRRSAPPCPASVDTCGAGDRFSGAVALALASGQPLTDAVGAAVADVADWLAAGGVATVATGGTRAAAPPAGVLSRRASRSGRKATARPPLHLPAGLPADELVRRVRAGGATVVATGGCFDVLHAGHLALLEAARDLGSALVVVLNSDASTRRLKGPGRPVTTAADRARLLEALRCVDAVAVFEDDDPSDTLARLRPDVWVKGGDYRVEDLPEAAVVHGYGGRVQIVPFAPGHSTTSVLQRVGDGPAWGAPAP